MATLQTIRRDAPPKVRSFTFDGRHVAPMIFDFMQVVIAGLRDKSRRRHLIQLGRDIRQRAFDLRNAIPEIEHADLASFLGCSEPKEIMLPPLGVITLAGLGHVAPYAILASVVSALQPKVIFETGTFRGVGALTMALNAPHSEVYTLDLPEESGSASTTTLTRGDAEWVRLSRGCVGIAFKGHPVENRIHQLFSDSLKFDAAERVASADFCFIDGGHSYECIKADTENALKVLSPQGVILWDDYTWFTGGVSKYICELAREMPLKRIAGTQYIIYRHET